MGLSMGERRAVTEQMARRYAKASRVQKTAMLDELCELTGWTRRHARRALTGASTPSGPTTEPARPRVYGEETLTPLTKIWATLGGSSGKRLAPFMHEIVKVLERCGELEVSDQTRRKLLSVSAATIDRMLAPERARLRVKGRSGTAPGSMLRRQIPIRTFADWDDARPGFLEVDLVRPRRRHAVRTVLPEPRRGLRGNGVDRGQGARQQGPALVLRGDVRSRADSRRSCSPGAPPPRRGRQPREGAAIPSRGSDRRRPTGVARAERASG